MNKTRRQQIKEIVKKLEDIKSRLEDVNDEEEMAFDNMPENLQGTLRGMDSEEAIDNMNSAIDLLDEAISTLENII